MVALDVSGADPVPVSEFATVRQPNSVAVDPETGTVYVAGTADGVVQIVTADDTGLGLARGAVGAPARLHREWSPRPLRTIAPSDTVAVVALASFASS